MKHQSFQWLTPPFPVLTFPRPCGEARLYLTPRALRLNWHDMTRIAALLLGLIAVCGCDSGLHLKPMPVIYGPGRMDLASMIPESRRTTTLQVFYATNRKPDGPANDRTYGNDVDSSLHLGISTIQMGDKGDSWADVAKASTGQDGNPIFKLTNSSELADPTAFYDAINQQIAITPNHEVNIFVQRFNSQLSGGVELLGKMRNFSRRRGVILSFAWPARQSMFLYGGDVERGKASAHFLADLIEQIAANTNAENINVLSYSVGAVCATNGLLELRKRHQDQSHEELAKSLRIGYVIYAASDLDLETFARVQIVKIKQLAQAVVIYVSSDDWMLAMASFVHGASRLGHPDASKFTKQEQEAVAKDPQIQVIDVTGVPETTEFGGLGHYYWYANDWIMTDVLVNFRWQISPDQRGLYHKPGMSRWYFPKDYPDKVTAAVKQMTMPTTAPANPFGGTPLPTTMPSTAAQPASSPTN